MSKLKLYEPPEDAYTGVGNRDAPDPAKWLARQTSRILSRHGFVLRSGGALGMDSSFYSGATTSEVYPPWDGFEGFKLRYPIPEEAFKMAKDIVGPRWSRMGEGQRKLMARNMQEVLGADLRDPSKFLLCYTRDGCDSEKTYTKRTGGTGVAIICADRHNVPVVNFYHPDWAEQLTIFSGVDFLALKDVFRDYLLKLFGTA